MTITTYLVPLRTGYDEQTHSIVLRLGRGRRPRAAAATLPAEGVVELDARGRLTGLILMDSKFLHLGQRLVGLPALPPDSPTPHGNAITYDLAGRVARVCLRAIADAPQRITRAVRIDVDAQERLLAIHIPVMGSRRRDPDLYVALSSLGPAQDDRYD